MIIGTRGSRLAMVQADMASEAIRKALPDMKVEMKVVTTEGDRDRCTPLENMGGNGAFTKELDQKLMSGEIDVAVNSLKDMPSALTPGTRLAAVLPRGPVEDALISRQPLLELPEGAKVGTSSVRRRALLRYLRPDLDVADLRGNVTTRINKWRRGEYQAIVLAEAGLVRLGESVPRHLLDPVIWVPPAGQGAVALVCREGDVLGDRLASLNDDSTRRCVDLERAIMLRLGASCQVPLGVWATVRDGRMEVRCLLLSPGGERAKRWEASVPLDHGTKEVEAVLRAIELEWGCLD